MSDDLTAEQAELLEEIESDEPSIEAITALDDAIEKFDFSATLLATFADWLRNEGDAEAADIVLACSAEMATHEARTA